MYYKNSLNHAEQVHVRIVRGEMNEYSSCTPIKP